jgi:glycerophosphoryl diester phosphodiesterase
MKIFYFVIAVLLLSCSASKKNMSTKFAANPVVAHRGAFKKNSLPENSIASLKEAIRLRCTGSEFDVRMSSDDSLVINHDPKHHEMQIEKTTYAELIKVKLSNGEKLPTLRELLIAGLENNKTTRLVVEIKPSDVSKERAKAIAQKTVELIKELRAEPMVAYISFDYDILKKVQELDPRASTQYLNGDYTPEQLKEGGISGLDYNIAVFRKNPDWITRAQKANLILNAWTVNSQADMKWLLDNKFQFITTNEPELLLSMTTR